MAYYLAPPGTMINMKKAPVWSSTVSKSVSGRRRAVQRFAAPEWRFTLSYEFLSRKPNRNDLDALWAFFGMAQGQTNEFFFLDVDDHTVSNVIIGTGDGTTTSFQLLRAIQVGGLYYQEPVTAWSGTPSFFVNGVEQFATSISSRGIATLATAPASGAVVAWTGTFLYRCAFDKDTIDTQQAYDMLWELSGLTFTSVKR